MRTHTYIGLLFIPQNTPRSPEFSLYHEACPLPTRHKRAHLLNKSYNDLREHSRGEVANSNYRGLVAALLGLATLTGVYIISNQINWVPSVTEENSFNKNKRNQCYSIVYV